MPTPTAVEIILTDEERAALRAWTARRKTGQALALRARIVLAAAGQLTNREIAELEGVSAPTVTKWRNRFAQHRLEGLMDEPRPGRPRTISDADVETVLVTTLESSPKNATHWSTRSMAAQTGLSQNAVLRIWHAFGLQPHRRETWKLSTDQQLIEKVHDICGLYLNPPERAVVLAVDEKSQIQALDRTAPTLPMLPGTPQRATHDYQRNGTTSLYAALEIQTGEVTGACYPKHTHHEFLAFLNRLVKAYPRRPLHVVLDNSSTHSTPEVNRWLERHRRVHFHFTPTSASWMNMVEIWFSILTKQQVRRGVYHDVPELIAAIEHFIDGYNDRAQPFVWTKTPDQVLAKASERQDTSDALH